MTVYDKGFDQPADSYGEYITRSGDIWSPRLSNQEPLRLECRHFISLVNGDGDAQRVAQDGLAVVRVLEQLQASLEQTLA